MSYEINRSDGTVLTTVRDGVLRRDVTPITLIGRGSLGFGDAMNENFFHLLENFSNVIAPLNPIRGQLWYDTATLTMKFYTGTEWKPFATASNSSISVGDPTNGSTLGADGILTLFRTDGSARVEFRDSMSGAADATLQMNGAGLRVIGTFASSGLITATGGLTGLASVGADYGNGYAILRNGQIEVGSTDANMPRIDLRRSANPSTGAFDVRLVVTGNDLDVQFDDPAGMLRVEGFEVFHRGNFDPSGTTGFDNPITVSGGLPAGSFTTIGNDGTIELCNTGDFPRIDFKNDPVEDFDIRLQKTGTFLHVIGTSNAHGLRVASGTANGTSVILSQEGGIEVIKTDGGAFIDFKNAQIEDFDVRLAQNGTALNLTCSGNFSVVRTANPCVFVTKTGVGGGGWIFNNANLLAAVETDVNGGILGTYFTLNPANRNAVFTADITGFSDAKLKTDVETISGALALVEQMRGVRFTRIDTGARGIGVIAQETQAVVPEVVQETDGTLSVAYGNLTGILIESDKELAAQNRALKAEVASLKDMVSALVERVKALEAR
jgi:hypothetical protein